MKVIVWELPKEQMDYIKENCKEELLSGEVCIMEPETARELLAEIEVEKQNVKKITKLSEWLIVSENPAILLEAGRVGMAVAAYLPSDRFDEVTLPPVDMVIEGFE